MLCQRCNNGADDGRDVPAATTQQHYQQYDPWPAHWPDTVTYRCDDCAQALREYAALPSISMTITKDEPIDPTLVGEEIR